MQANEATKLQQEWRAKGYPACVHPDLDKEYYLGSATGDYVCTTCGEPFSRAEKQRMGK